jgi:spore maturation protein CgeB
MSEAVDIVVLGLSLSSSWGNGHATTWRSLIKGLGQQGQRVVFLEREQAWYSANRDLAEFPHCRLEFYRSTDELAMRHERLVRDAPAVIVGSYVPDGIKVGRWVCETARNVRAFYDIDTPVTLAHLATNECAYLDRELVRAFDVYLSFTGGPTLVRLERDFGARRAVPLYCSVDADAYRPLRQPRHIDLGYLGTYSVDRQARLESLLLAPARALARKRFSVVGAQYPETIAWPANVQRLPHLPPPEHARFYSSQRYTLNVTRSDMVAAGYSPSVRLFEAGACETPVISDVWQGMEEFFDPGREILLAHDSQEVCSMLEDIPERQRRRIARAARARVLTSHTGMTRAHELVKMLRCDEPRNRVQAIPQSTPRPVASLIE